MIGFLNINKPFGITSHDVVAGVRRASGIKQIGHGGTLDPAATGVLPLAIGKATRLLRFLDTTKIYIAEILLGTSTTTDDLEGEIIHQSPVNTDPHTIENCLRSFVGDLQQIPPQYSAIKLEGKRLYSLARSGVKIDNLPAREVTVHSIEILQLALPVVKLRITCSTGTYIRAIARDLGNLLSCGGCLKSLHRQRSGQFDDSNSISLDEVKSTAQENKLENFLITPLQALNMPVLELESCQAISLMQGQSLSTNSFLPKLPDPSYKYVAAILDKRLIAICQNIENYKLKPEVVVGDTESLD